MTMEKEKRDLEAYEPICWYSEEDGCYLAKIPEIGGCIADGETIQGALKNVRELQEILFDVAESHGWKIPEPRTQ